VNLADAGPLANATQRGTTPPTQAHSYARPANPETPAPMELHQHPRAEKTGKTARFAPILSGAPGSNSQDSAANPS